MLIKQRRCEIGCRDLALAATGDFRDRLEARGKNTLDMQSREWKSRVLCGISPSRKSRFSIIAVQRHFSLLVYTV